MYLIEFAAIYMTQSESSVFGVLSLYSLWKTLSYRTGWERQFRAGFVKKPRTFSGMFPP
jgi:hypothetical protein